MILIQDRLFVEIKIDGKPLAGGNLVSSIALLEGTPVICPSCILILNDHSQTLSQELCLTDGNEILVTIGRSPNDLKTVTRQYRLYNVDQVAGQQGPTLRVIGLYDAPQYTTESARDSYSGTSSQVLKQIADKCKLEYDGPEDFNGRTTNDSQVWLGVAKARGAVVQHDIARYAYMDDHSAMYAALTSLGILKFRNLMDVIATPMDDIKYVFTHNMQEGDQEESLEVYYVRESQERSDAGLMNSWQNYGSTIITQTPSGTQVEETVDVKTSASYLAINDQVSKTIQRSRVEYGSLDCGNVHDKYYRAAYQNKRQLALFSERISMLLTDPTEVQLFDPVLYKQANADPYRPVRNSDIYIVVGKTVFLSGTNYGERIELARMSITEKGEAELKSSEPASARESSIPDTLVDPSARVAANTVGRTRGILAVTSGIETKFSALREKAGTVLSNTRLTLPSLSNFARNLKDYSEFPNKAIRDVRSAAMSARQMRETVEEYNLMFKDAKDAARSGNATLIADAINPIARSAAFFRPQGIAENFTCVMGTAQVVRTSAEMYQSVARELQVHRNFIDSTVGIGSEIDSLVGDMYGVVDAYNNQMSYMASTYNTLIYAVTGDSPNLRSPNMDLNRYYLEDTIRQSVAPITTPLDSISYSVPPINNILNGVSSKLRDRDDSRNYTWAPEDGYIAAVTRPDALIGKLTELDNTLNSAVRQYDDYEHVRRVS